MAVPPWKATQDVNDIIAKVKENNHPHLQEAKIAAAFDDSKAFKKDRLNWGKTQRFSNLNKLWQVPQSFDFLIVIPSDVWIEVLDADQKEAFIDLRLTCCQVEYEPETIVENGKKKVIKDQLGRVKYTKEMKFDDNGEPKWKVVPLDLWVFTQNVSRYGLWCSELAEFNQAVSRKSPEKKVVTMED